MNPPNGDTFLDLVRDTIASDALLPPGARVLVACSGGGDSMALLHVLHRLGYAVTVAHLDHASRPESADDAAWLREQVVALGLPFESARHPVAEEASSLGVSFEAHARTVRYAFLVRTARRLECDAIATGHTGSDQAETVLLRLVRGSGPAGLGGIPPLGNHGGVPVARPLLRVSRDAVRAWLVSQDIAWREDASNDDDSILRNRIRHRLLPLLRDEFNDQIDQSLARLADICREEEAWLRPQAAEAWVACIDAQARISRERFAALPGALQRRGVVAFLQESDVETSYDQVTLLVDFIRSAPVGARHCLPGGALLYAGREWVECVNPADEDEEEAQLPVPGSITAFGRRFLARRIDVPPLETLASRCTPTRQCFDADALGNRVTIRLRRPGDRMKPFGAPGSRKVSDIMVDEGIPAPRRAQVPLLLSGDTIVWIAGGPVSQTVAITAQTRAAVEVEIMDAPQFRAPH
jgi:tRNA(Ile)-lysidine synthase